jgi:hypothetical protein
MTMQTEIEKNVQLALSLKLQNLHYAEVAERMGRPVGTIKRWLLPYKEQWLEKSLEAKQANALNSSLKNKAKCDDLKKQAYDAAYKNAEEDLKDVLLRDFVNLYVGEGTKKSKSVAITNSDLHTILAAFVAMKKYFWADNKYINVDIKHYEANDNEEELLNYWSKLLGHDKSIKLKTYVQKRGNPNPDSHNNSNKFGLITVSIHDVYAKEKLTAYMDYLKAKWLKDFEATFNTKVDQSIKQVVSVKKD